MDKPNANFTKKITKYKWIVIKKIWWRNKQINNCKKSLWQIIQKDGMDWECTFHPFPLSISLFFCLFSFPFVLFHMCFFICFPLDICVSLYVFLKIYVFLYMCFFRHMCFFICVSLYVFLYITCVSYMCFFRYMCFFICDVFLYMCLYVSLSNMCFFICVSLYVFICVSF